MANKINWNLSLEMFGSLNPQVQTYLRLAYKQSFKCWVVDSVRGYCNYRRKEITIPTWAYNKGNDYLSYYVAHELAHIFAGSAAMHGPVFMDWFKKICPENLWHFELEYKPRNAQVAGISKPNQFKLIDL